MIATKIFEEGQEHSQFGILWHSFRIVGIDIREPQRREKQGSPYLKCLTWLVIVYFVICFIYSTTYSIMYYSTVYVNFRALLGYTTTNITAAYLWITMYRTRHRIRRLLFQVSLIRFRMRLAPMKANRTINCVTVLLWTSLLLCGVLEVILVEVYGPEIDLKGLAFGLTTESTGLKRLVTFFCYVALFLTDVVLPSFFNIALCALYYDCWSLLQQYELKLRSSVKRNNPPIPVVLLYSEVTSILENANSVLSVPSFLVSFILSMKLFFVFLWIGITGRDDWEVKYIIEEIYFSVVTAPSIVALIVIAAKVPLKMESIRNTMEKIYENTLHRSSSADSIHLKILENAVRKKSIVMSACHVLHFRRSTVLSVFGAVLTYGLLFMSIKALE